MAKSRYLYIDLLRSWAMTIMIEVHVVNAFMLPILRETLWFPALNFINGLVAPSFIFISGFAFVVSVHGKGEELRGFGDIFRKRLRRIFLIFIVGYLIHVPYYSLGNIIKYASPEEMKHFYNVDVLQCTAAGLLILLFFRIVLKDNRAFHIAVSAMTILVASLSPVVWKYDFAEFLPLPIACYFNDLHGSFFPLFPWSAFLFGGASFAMFVLAAERDSSIEVFMKKIGSISLVLALILFAIVSYLCFMPWYNIKPSPLFFAERLAIVIFLVSLLWVYQKNKNSSDSWFLAIGRESLLVYWLHLQIIYRHLWSGRSLENIYGLRLTFVQAIGSSLLLIFSMFVVAFIWNKIKSKSPKMGKVLFWLVVFAFLWKFTFY